MASRASGRVSSAVNQVSASPVSVMWRTWAVTFAPVCQLMSAGSQALMRWPRLCASRIIAKVVSL
jgi:hypothetical protein